LDEVALRGRGAQEPLDLVVAGIDRLADLPMVSAVGEAVVPGSRIRLAGQCRLPPRAHWERWLGGGEALATAEEVQELLPRGALTGVDLAAQCAAIEDDSRRLHAELTERYADAEGFIAGADALCARWALDHFHAVGVPTRPGSAVPMTALCAHARPEFHK